MNNQNQTAAAAPLKKPAGHLPGLDGLRGIAILAVLLHHFLPPHYPQGIPNGLHGIFIKIIYRLFDVGWWGVDLFFVLSGFLITGILIDAKGKEHFFRNFYARRSLRIFPLYYGVLFALFVALPALAAAAPALRDWLGRDENYVFIQSLAPKQAWLWLYGTNIKTAIDGVGWTFGFMTHFWSLAVEEHFYLVWPFVVFLCDRQTLVRVCAVVAAGSVVARILFLCGGMEPAYIFVLTPCRLDGLALGGLVAALCRGPGGAEAVLPGALRVLKIVGPVALLTLLTLNRFGVFMIILGHALLAGAFASALPFAALAGAGAAESGGKAGKWLCLPALRLLGKYSYGIYMLHPFIVEPVDKFVASAGMKQIIGGSYEAYAISRSSLSLFCALALAYASWHLYEKHFLKLKAFFPTSGKRPAPAVGAGPMPDGIKTSVPLVES